MMGDTLIGVIDDKGNKHYLPKDLFITVEEIGIENKKDIRRSSIVLSE
jgi:hypothetical protein